MRQISRERPLEAIVPNGLGQCLQADTTSPSGKASRKEEAALLHAALERLPPDYARVLTLRHLHDCSFAEIGESMDRSSDAARMLWWRALDALAAELEKLDEDQLR
jgi:RNA polymerase sigma factor (sigma-70 family)